MAKARRFPRAFSEPSSSRLLELMSDVVDNGEENKMSLDAIAIVLPPYLHRPRSRPRSLHALRCEQVLSPNLYTPLAEGADPYEALHHAKARDRRDRAEIEQRSSRDRTRHEIARDWSTVAQRLHVGCERRLSPRGLTRTGDGTLCRRATLRLHKHAQAVGGATPLALAPIPKADSP